MEKYKLEYRGNVKEFEDYILDNLRREQEQGQSLRWSKFVEVYARQLAIIQECPYPETESELGNDETPPSIKLIDQNTEYVGNFYRWGLHVVGIGNFRVIFCIHNYYKVVLLHQFDKKYNGAIRKEDLTPAEAEYESLCYEEPQRN